ncbi:MAG: sugar ABC transporter permease, partial [Gemmatimonadaceae bacterium]
MRRELTVEQQRARAAWLFIAPALLLVALFFLLPVVASFLLSVTDFDLYALAHLSNVRVVGVHNYVALAGNPEFWSAVANTFYFA